MNSTVSSTSSTLSQKAYEYAKSDMPPPQSVVSQRHSQISQRHSQISQKHSQISQKHSQISQRQPSGELLDEIDSIQNQLQDEIESLQNQLQEEIARREKAEAMLKQLQKGQSSLIIE